MKRLLLLGLLVCSSSFALKEYYALSRSIRALGMGGAFYGLSNDEYALFYNPAGLSFYPGGGQGMFSLTAQTTPSVISAIDTLTNDMKNGGSLKTNQLASDLSQFQGNPLYADVTLMPFYYLTKHFALSLLVTDLKADFAILGQGVDSSVDVTAISDSGLLIGYGNELPIDNLYYGVTVKGLVRAGGHRNFSIEDIVQGAAANTDLDQLGGAGVGADFDLGLTYEFPTRILDAITRVSLVVNNVMATRFNAINIKGTPPGLPRMLTLAGYSRFPGWWWFDNFDFVIDLAEFDLGGESDPDEGERVGSFFKHVNFGVEVPMNGWFLLRTGFHQGWFSAGLGILTRFFKLDIATYEEELFGNPGTLGSRRFAMRLAFGVGAPAPAVEPATPTAAPPMPKVEEKPVVAPSAGEQKVEPAPTTQDKQLETAPKVEPAPTTQDKQPETAPKVEPAPTTQDKQPETAPKVEQVPSQTQQKQLETAPKNDQAPSQMQQKPLEKLDNPVAVPPVTDSSVQPPQQTAPASGSEKASAQGSENK